jgi:hypothetical protein
LTGIYQPKKLSRKSHEIVKNEILPQTDMITQNESKIRNSFQLDDEELDYEKEFNRSSTIGFNKYIHSSSKISPQDNEDKVPTFELETGRMSQKTSSTIYSQKEINKGSQYSITNSSIRKGKEKD